MSWYFYLRVAYHRLSCSELILILCIVSFSLHPLLVRFDVFCCHLFLSVSLLLKGAVLKSDTILLQVGVQLALIYSLCQVFFR